MNDNIPTVLVIFGITGDLSTNKLLPALYNLEKSGMLPDVFKVIGIARSPYSDNDFRNKVKQQMADQGITIEDASWRRFAQYIDFVQGDISKEKTYEDLASQLNKIDNKFGVCTHKVVYLAISPDLLEAVFAGIKKTQMLQICRNPKDTRVVVEKPFGSSLDDFRKLNSYVMKAFTEPQVYRVDHFVAKETVQNLLYFRAANPLFFGDWNKENIELVELEAYESLGVGSRGKYYDSYGQLRDMVQSHLLQLLAITLMKLPAELTAEAISKAKVDVINSLKVDKGERSVIRGQYQAGVVNGEAVKAYTEEADIPVDSRTETYVEINATLNGREWEGMKVRMLTGKRMYAKQTRIMVHYRDKEVVKGFPAKNKLIVNIQPSEGITLEMQVKKPGSESLIKVPMSFNYKDNFQLALPEAYEKVLLDIIRLKKGISLSSEELEASWKFIDPIMKRWQTSNDLIYYPSGSKKIA